MSNDKEIMVFKRSLKTINLYKNIKTFNVFTNLFREDSEVPLLLLVHIPLIIDLLLCSQMKNLPNYQKKKDGGKENWKYVNKSCYFDH